jgi:hypothetical protein
MVGIIAYSAIQSGKNGRNSGEFRDSLRVARGLQKIVSATQAINNAGGVRRLVRRISS